MATTALAGRKRRRSSNGAGTKRTKRTYSARQKAIRSAYWKRKHYPASQYYSRYYKRGPASLTRYGPSYFGATEEQIAHRKADHMYGQGLYKGRYGRGLYKGQRYGRGLYKGQGGFWGNVRKGLGSAWAHRQKWLTPTLNAADTVADTLGYGAISHPLRNIARETGIGAYRTNGLIEGSTDFAPSFGPSITGGDTGEISFHNIEKVRNIYAPSEMNAQDKYTLWEGERVVINAGLNESFPWLSQIAQNYGKYSFKQLIFFTKSEVKQSVLGEGQYGKIMMTTQMNVDDKPFKSQQDMEDHSITNFVQGLTNDELACGVECDPEKTDNSSKWRKVRTQNIDWRSEERSRVDTAILTLATTGVPKIRAGHKIGELWVSYTVSLMQPLKGAQDGKNILQDTLVLSPGPSKKKRRRSTLPQ